MIEGGAGPQGSRRKPGTFHAAGELNPGQADAGCRPPPAARGRAEGETAQPCECYLSDVTFTILAVYRVAVCVQLVSITCSCNSWTHIQLIGVYILFLFILKHSSLKHHNYHY